MQLGKTNLCAKSSETRGDEAHRQDKKDANLSFDHRDTIHPDTRLRGRFSNDLTPLVRGQDRDPLLQHTAAVALSRAATQ